jgi:hypothetical protein
MQEFKFLGSVWNRDFSRMNFTYFFAYAAIKLSNLTILVGIRRHYNPEQHAIYTCHVDYARSPKNGVYRHILSGRAW